MGKWQFVHKKKTNSIRSNYRLKGLFRYNFK